MAMTSGFQVQENTTVGSLFADAAEQHPGKSGFSIICHGRPALNARVALTELAERTLDVQYYIWEADATGRILADRLLRAADRGVRVRVLLDDINLSGRDEMIASLNAHPCIEVRIFNPFRNRKARVLDALTDMERVNHRMHNKIMVMDDAIAIVGGRNVGDHYFEVHQKSNFRDLDIAAVGPVVRETTAVFERFWNGDWSVPIGELVKRTHTHEDLERGRRTMAERIAHDHYPHPLDQDTRQLTEALESVRDELIWAPGTIVWDDPSSIRQKQDIGRMLQALFDRVDRLESEILIESAYFVPRDRGIGKIQALVEAGKRVRILTNSLASNDVLAAHAGYAKRRRALVATGAEIHEFRPDPDDVRQRLVSTKSQAGLHTKALVFDRRDVFIGSFNLDPRSDTINTEAGLYVESEELARQVIAFLDEGASPNNSYRVRLDEAGRLSWHTRDAAGGDVRFTKDPRSSAWQRLAARMIGWLPVEHQL